MSQETKKNDSKQTEQESTSLKALTEAYHEACDRKDYGLCDLLREEIRKSLLKIETEVSA